MRYLAISLAWGVAAILAVVLDTDELAFVLAGSYLTVGAGLPAAMIVSEWPEIAQGRSTRALTTVLTIALFSFCASSLGGQPLIWTSNWTPTSHLVTTVGAAGLLAALVLVRRQDLPERAATG